MYLQLVPAAQGPQWGRQVQRHLITGGARSGDLGFATGKGEAPRCGVRDGLAEPHYHLLGRLYSGTHQPGRLSGWFQFKAKLPRCQRVADRIFQPGEEQAE